MTKLKSYSRGYASLIMILSRIWESPIFVKLDILLNGELVDALSTIACTVTNL
ncbi:MAG: hypothetical protein IPI04_08985 [Ignavibacteria bacterium]|nr:hypothetical protein [Ignavibacteria bacterium]